MTRAAATDRRAPTSRVAKLAKRTRKRSIAVSWTGADTSPAGARASGISRFELWRSTDGGRFRLLLTTTRSSRRVTLRRGGRYAFYTVAIDHAGNRERAPKHPDARLARR